MTGDSRGIDNNNNSSRGDKNIIIDYTIVTYIVETIETQILHYIDGCIAIKNENYVLPYKLILCSNYFHSNKTQLHYYSIVFSSTLIFSCPGIACNIHCDTLVY